MEHSACVLNQASCVKQGALLATLQDMPLLQDYLRGLRERPAPPAHLSIVVSEPSTSIETEGACLPCRW